MSKHPTVLSLFSGAGGLDYGFEAAGYRTAVAVEMEPNCCRTLRTNRDWPVIESSIHDVSTAEILATAGLSPGDATVLIGGPPCQPFSKSGYWAHGDAKRLDDPRAATLDAYMRVLEEALPQCFLLENVAGLAFSGKSEGLDFLVGYINKINERTGSNYRPAFKVLRAADYGVPQLRDRFIMVANRDGALFKFPSPSHASPEVLRSELNLGLEPYRTAWDALGDLRADPEEDLALRGKWAALLPSIPEGNNYLWHTERGGGRPLFGWRRRFWSFLLKLSKSRPSWTLQAQPGPATGPFHWENRRLSMREMCRLQTFPDDVVVTGSRNAVQRQVGNAVPSLLGEVLARSIRTQYLDEPPASALPALLPPNRSPVPPPEEVEPVPSKFLVSEGSHRAHPGTGKGYRASGWSEQGAEV